MEIPSEVFKSSYCIFISAGSAPAFDLFIKNKGWNDRIVKIIKSNFKPDLACIVIPDGQNFRELERELFNFQYNNELHAGFWGQYGMTYPGQTWTSYSGPWPTA